MTYTQQGERVTLEMTRSEYERLTLLLGCPLADWFNIDTNESSEPSILCPQCGRRSHNQNDVRERYCGFCHQWHADMR
jgi:hypothetical protein